MPWRSRVGSRLLVFGSTCERFPVSNNLAAKLIGDVSRSRLDDLAARKADGNLTAIETLALAVLRGGRDGEEAVGPFIDAALEEYNHGTYRVPVRVVCDPSRLLLILTPDARSYAGQEEVERIAARLREEIKTRGSLVGMVLILPAGCRAQAIEVEPARAGVEVAPQTV